MASWKRLGSEIVYHNHYIKIHEDQVVTPDGKPGSYGWIETGPAVFIVAVDNESRVCLVKQQRYTTGTESWEVPAGGTGTDDPLPAAKRELAEEAGLEADHWEQLAGEFYPFQALSPEPNIVLVATGLRPTPKPEGTDDVISEVTWLPWSDVLEQIKDGELRHGQSIVSIMRAGLHLGFVAAGSLQPPAPTPIIT